MNIFYRATLELAGMTVREYLSSFHADSTGEGQFVNHNRDIFLVTLEEYDRYESYSNRRVTPSLQNLSMIIQTGPHCCIGLVPQTFLAHAIAAATGRLRSRTLSVVYQCSTVTLEETPKDGPGWLTLDAGAFNLFGLSRKQLAKTSACAPIGDVRLERLIAFLSTSDYAESMHKEMFGELIEVRATSVSECTRKANSIIGAHLLEKPGEDVITVDESFVTKLMVSHLNRDTLIARILTDVPSVSLLHKIHDSGAVAKDGSYTSILFWSLRNGKISQCWHSGGELIDRHGKICSISIQGSLGAALIEGKLVPRLFSTFLFLSILNNFTAIGGVRQLSYYPLLFSTASAWIGRCLGRKYMSELTQRHGWGHFIWSDPLLSTKNIIAGTDLDKILKDFLEMPLSQASNGFASFEKRSISLPV
jgi:hypothetical protein